MCSSRNRSLHSERIRTVEKRYSPAISTSRESLRLNIFSPTNKGITRLIVDASEGGPNGRNPNLARDLLRTLELSRWCR